MSNASFDSLCKTLAIKEANGTLGRWESSRASDDLTAQDIEFLDRQIAGAKKLLEDRKEAASRWWE